MKTDLEIAEEWVRINEGSLRERASLSGQYVANVGALLAKLVTEVRTDAEYAEGVKARAPVGSDRAVFDALERVAEAASAFYEETAPPLGSTVPYSSMPAHVRLMTALRELDSVQRQIPVVSA
jgi:hypothetical protein